MKKVYIFIKFIKPKNIYLYVFIIVKQTINKTNLIEMSFFFICKRGVGWMKKHLVKCAYIFII